MIEELEASMALGFLSSSLRSREEEERERLRRGENIRERENPPIPKIFENEPPSSMGH